MSKKLIIAALEAIGQGYIDLAAAVGEAEGGDAKPAKGGKVAAPAKGAIKKGSKGKAKEAVDFDTVKEKLTELVKEKDKETAIAALGVLGVEKLGELEEDKYAEAIEYFQKVIDGEEDPTAEGEGEEEEEDLI